MPRKGYRQSPEHIAMRRAGMRETLMVNGALEFFNFVMMLSSEERHEIIADRIEDLEETMAETERLLATGAGRRRGIRNSAGIDSAIVERFRAALKDDIHRILSQEETMYDAASTPYVGMTETRHIPMTGTHSHDHAAFGDHDHDDGIHSHEHSHEGDAHHRHDHDAESHPTQSVSQPVDRASGVYGRQMGSIGPVARRRLKDAQLRIHEANR